MFRTAFSGEWFDLLANVENASGTIELTRELFRDGTNSSGLQMRFFHHGQDDELQLIAQLNHDVKIPGEARLHIHLVPMATPVLNTSDLVCWRVSYFILARNGSELPRNITNWTTSTFSRQIPVTSKYMHMAHSLVTIPLPEGLPASSMIVARVARLGNTGGALDTYKVNKDTGPGGTTGAANLGVTYIDLHVQRSRAGTRGEFE